jgi:hypothetical protein
MVESITVSQIEMNAMTNAAKLAAKRIKAGWAGHEGWINWLTEQAAWKAVNLIGFDVTIANAPKSIEQVRAFVERRKIAMTGLDAKLADEAAKVILARRKAAKEAALNGASPK